MAGRGQAWRATPRAIVHYARWMTPPATLLMWFQLRSPELAEDFERLMTEDRDIVRGSLDTVSDWRLMRPADMPGQSIGQADYVLIAEILEVERFEQQASALGELGLRGRPPPRGVRLQTSAASFGVGDSVWAVLDAPTRRLR
jgi:hypothetical protein